MSSNKHQRLHQLEKLANEKRVKAKSLAAKLESIALQATVAALSDSDLLAQYQAVQTELSNQPIDPAIANLSTKELIDRYTQLCQDHK